MKHIQLHNPGQATRASGTESKLYAAVENFAEDIATLNLRMT